MSLSGPRPKRRIEQLAGSIVTRRNQSALAIALLAGGGGYLYIRNAQQAAADRRKKLRAALRSAPGTHCLLERHSWTLSAAEMPMHVGTKLHAANLFPQARRKGRQWNQR